MTGEQAFELEFPASVDYLVTARLFVAGAAAELGCGEEVADDLRLAVSEAAGSLLGSGGPITVTVSGADAKVAVAVRAPGLPAAGEAPQELVLGLELVRALLGQVTVQTTAGETEIAFSAGCAE